MNFAGVEQRNTVVTFLAKNERQLSSGENDAFDVDLCFHAIDDGEQAGVRLGNENSRNELREIFFVDVILVFRFRDNEFDSFTAKNFLIKIRLHRVTRSEKREP